MKNSHIQPLLQYIDRANKWVAIFNNYKEFYRSNVIINASADKVIELLQDHISKVSQFIQENNK